MRRALLGGLLALTAAGCAVGPAEVPMMGSAHIASDFDTYSVRRVGLLPFRAVGGQSNVLASHEVGPLETSFHAELAGATNFDLVPLRSDDLAAVLPPDPFRDGWYTSETVRTLRDRFRLDALLTGSITSRRLVPPQVLGVQLDLISCETGATIWSADLILDAAQGSTREAVAVWARRELQEDDGGAMVLLSPRKFAHFAAFQLARLL